MWALPPMAFGLRLGGPDPDLSIRVGLDEAPVLPLAVLSVPTHRLRLPAAFDRLPEVEHLLTQL